MEDDKLLFLFPTGKSTATAWGMQRGDIMIYIYIYIRTYFVGVSFSKSKLLFIHAFPLIFKCTKRRCMSLLHSFFINTGTLFYFLNADHGQEQVRSSISTISGVSWILWKEPVSDPHVFPRLGIPPERIVAGEPGSRRVQSWVKLNNKLLNDSPVNVLVLGNWSINIYI